MGRITIFVKGRCRYCEKVKHVIREAIRTQGKPFMRHKQHNAVWLTLVHPVAVLPRKDSLQPYFGIELCLVDVSKDAARSAQCIALTGSRTVPHVFFNEEHIGNANKCQQFDMCGELCRRLCALATQPSASFPPEPEASFIKLTEDLAFASQPTLNQIRSLGSIGFRSVVSLVHEDEPCYLRSEGVVAGTSGLQFFRISPQTAPRIPISHIEVDLLPGLATPAGPRPCSAAAPRLAASVSAPPLDDSARHRRSGAAPTARGSPLHRSHHLAPSDRSAGSGPRSGCSPLVVPERVDEGDAVSSSEGSSVDDVPPCSHAPPPPHCQRVMCDLHMDQSAAPTCAASQSESTMPPPLEIGPPAAVVKASSTSRRPAEGPEDEFDLPVAVADSLPASIVASTSPLAAIIREEEAAAARRGVTMEQVESTPGAAGEDGPCCASLMRRDGAPYHHHSVPVTHRPTPLNSDDTTTRQRRNSTDPTALTPPTVERERARSVESAPHARTAPPSSNRRSRLPPSPVAESTDETDERSPPRPPAQPAHAETLVPPLLASWGLGRGSPRLGGSASARSSIADESDISSVWSMQNDDLDGRPVDVWGDPSSRSSVWTTSWCRQVLAVLDTCRKPVLVHCQTGVAACTVSLLRVARSMAATERQVITWAKEFGHDIAAHHDLDACVAVLVSERDAIEPTVPPSPHSAADRVDPASTVASSVNAGSHCGESLASVSDV